MNTCPQCGSADVAYLSYARLTLCNSCMNMTSDELAATTRINEVVELAMPVTGHRVWGLDVKGMRLTSAYGGWDSGLMEAVCHADGSHEAPHWPEQGSPSCMCGINAYKLRKPLTALHTAKDGSPGVAGIVDLGGRVYEYEDGYRAQYGRLMEATIITPTPYGGRFLSYLSEKYEAPFRAMSWFDYQNEWSVTHGRDRETIAEDQDTEAGAPSGTPAGPLTIASAGKIAVTSTGASANKDWLMDMYAAALERSVYQPLTFRGALKDVPLSPTVDAVEADGRWQPVLGTQRLHTYLSLKPEWRTTPLLSHKPVTYRSKARALRVGRRVQRGSTWNVKPLRRII